MADTTTDSIAQLLADLQTQVERDTTVNGSATTLISNLAAKVSQLTDELEQRGVPADQLTKFRELVAQLGANQDGLASAVEANTATT